MTPTSLLLSLDHLVYATPDLEATCIDLESKLGVRASPGGQHPGRGTRNALIAIGPQSYLEIIGPDPAQADIKAEWFGIDRLVSPKLVTWATRVTDLENFVRGVSPNVNLGPVRSGSRRTPDGSMLSWRLTEPQLKEGDSLIPFLIEWDSHDHPAFTATPGPPLVLLSAEHPEPELIKEKLGQLQIELPVARGPATRLIAVFETPSGRIELT